MPKDEFDFEDPFELNGMAFLSAEDTTDAMAECFTEEFMRMGYSHQQILALFRNPQYLGPQMAFEKRGEAFIRDLIAVVFARWGKVVTWPNVTPNPRPPALSPAEGERSDLEILKTRASPSLRPRGGGGRPGGGARGEPSAVGHAQAIQSDDALTDPMGSPIPKLNV